MTRAWLWTLVLANLCSIVAIVGAIYVMTTGRPGWGWLLVIAVLMHSTPKKSQ